MESHDIADSEHLHAARDARQTQARAHSPMVTDRREPVVAMPFGTPVILIAFLAVGITTLASMQNATVASAKTAGAEKVQHTTAKTVPSLGVKLNVGGARFTTTLSTLRAIPGSRLAELFSSRHNEKTEYKGYHFIDRDGTHFRHILNFLRDPGQFLPDVSGGEARELMVEAEYYGLTSAMSTVWPALATCMNQKNFVESIRPGYLLTSPGPLTGENTYPADEYGYNWKPRLTFYVHNITFDISARPILLELVTSHPKNFDQLVRKSEVCLRRKSTLFGRFEPPCLNTILQPDRSYPDRSYGYISDNIEIEYVAGCPVFIRHGQFLEICLQVDSRPGQDVHSVFRSLGDYP